jgi:hypothetical protein
MAAKKETSRIPLELATAAKPGVAEGKPAEAPKTIKIKPATAPSIAKIAPKPPVAAAAAATDEKRKTSRISLEAAFAEEAKPGEGPKTIKLKRPTEAATIKVGPRPTTDTTTEGAVLSKTARLDVPPAEEEEGPTPTKKRTVRIKRPGTEAPREEPSMAAAQAEPAAERPAPSAAPEVDDEPIWLLFPLLAVFVAVALLIYVLLASDLCPNMGWIGKITLLR